MALPGGTATATITATVDHPATIAAPGGTASLGITATVEHLATIAATSSADLAITAVVEHFATMAATSAATLAINATVTAPGNATMDLPLGTATLAVAATVDHPATLALPLGDATLAVTAVVEHFATMSLTSEATASIFIAGDVVVEPPLPKPSTVPGRGGQRVRARQPESRFPHKIITYNSRFDLGAATMTCRAIVTRPWEDDDDLVLMLPGIFPANVPETYVSRETPVALSPNEAFLRLDPIYYEEIVEQVRALTCQVEFLLAMQPIHTIHPVDR